MAVFTEVVTSITREKILPKSYDTVLKASPAVYRTMGNAKEWQSGFRLDSIIKYQKSNTGGLVDIGATLDTSRVSTRTKMQFDPKRRHKPVVIDDLELVLNQGDEQVLALLATEMDELTRELSDDVATDIYTANGAGSHFNSFYTASDDSRVKICAVVKSDYMLETPSIPQYVLA